ncbi:MAG: carbamoyltransferase HypF, partial [Thermodesulfobacteriaceae bacterium]|nr:carbamoyltransferase HypF [Thermodesulfobacteriaceae bacterium]
MERAFKIVVKGLVQGIGFRPYVFNLATFYALKGWVKNTSRGVEIWIEGKEHLLKSFLEDLPKKVPPPGSITELQFEEVNIQHYKNFEIIKGEGEERVELDLLPDLALCSFCKEELKDPENRRFEYPFIACTSCGPRFSVIEVLPYERENTTMRHFPLCKECDREYKDPTNRRFHAEAIACNRCGPQVVLVDPKGNLLAEKREALTLAQQFLREGKILALKGLTGFHLIARADREDIIETLRKRKKRPSKPLAIMVKDLEAAEKFVYLTKRDKELLTSPSAPILILKGKGNLPFNLTDGINLIGIFLPYSPLHYLLLKDLNFPIICTSGNFSGEPLLFENEEAMGKLSKIAHYFLLHNRPIKRPLDDSVLKKADDFYIMIRRSRGYTPLPQRIPFEIEKPLLAVGGNEKNTFALAFKNKIIVSHHIG